MPKPAATAAALAADINKKEGPGTILLASDIKREMLPRITSGSLALDVALGGGWPTNQWNEIIGEENHGKTAVVLKTIAANQAIDPDWTVLWVAAEDFVEEYAEMLGVDLERVILVDSNIMEVGYETAIKYIDSRSVDACVIDSLPAMSPDPEVNDSMYDHHPGLQARLTNHFFRKARKAMKRNLLEEERPCAGFVINQYREKIGVSYGDPRTTPGGKGKNFEFFTRVEVRRSEWITDDEQKERIHTRDGKTKYKPIRVGQEIHARVLKNKTAPGQRTAVFDFYFMDCVVAGVKYWGGDYDRVRETLAVAQQIGVLHHSGGGNYTFGDQKWRGFSKVEDAAADDPDLLESIASEVMLELERKRPRRARKRGD